MEPFSNPARATVAADVKRRIRPGIAASPSSRRRLQGGFEDAPMDAGIRGFPESAGDSSSAPNRSPALLGRRWVWRDDSFGTGIVCVKLS